MAKLYIVATPIGNLGDISKRCLETLEMADFIACEDTRVTSKLLSRYDIKKPLVSYYEHNKLYRGEQIIERVQAGENCALVTDAGTPAISDPGCDLVDMCQKSGVECVGVPGASAIVTALSIGGIECGRFCFEGFLSVNNKSRREHLSTLVDERRTMVFYEAPHKLLRTLNDFYATFGEREIALCRELTKIHEEVRRTTLGAAIEHYTQNAPRGEFVLIVGGKKVFDTPPEVDAVALVAELVSDGVSQSDAIKQVAREHNLSKNELYKKIIDKK